MKKLREHLDLTQDAFAEKIGCKKAHVSNVERGERGYSFDQVQNIVDQFGIDARYFFGQIDRVEDADLGERQEKPPTTENMMAMIRAIDRKITPAETEDEVAHRVAISAPLKEVVSLFYTEEAGLLRKLYGVVWYFLQEEKKSSSRTHEKGEAAQNIA